MVPYMKTEIHRLYDKMMCISIIKLKRLHSMVISCYTSSI